jgi:hypothetical protein
MGMDAQLDRAWAAHTEHAEEDRERENLGLHLLRAEITVFHQI